MAFSFTPRSTALMMALAVGAFGQAPTQKPLDENEAALMQVYLKANPLGDGLSVFPSGATGFVPLGEICRLLLFSIEVDAQSGQAKGFFIRPDRKFSLDMDARTVVSGGKSFPFTLGQVRRHGQELYVEAGLMESWFPIKLKLEFRDSSLYISSREPLPIEEAWARDKTNARLLAKGAGTMDAKGPFLNYPYHAFALPVVDLSSSISRGSGGGSSTPQVSANLGGDLLWMSSQIYLTRDAQGSFDSSRATLYRDDPDGGIMGPMHATHVSLGDAQRGASLSLAGGLPQGRGIEMDNHPMDYRTSFATRVFRGPLPSGWSVELFQNGGLVGYQQARPDATFEFPPVNMAFGLNIYKLVYRGPHGEQREENIRLDISQDMPAPGAFYYRLAAIQPKLQAQAPLLAPITTPTPTPGQAPSNPVTLLSRPTYLADAELGLTTRLSAQAGLMRLQYSDGTRTYSVMGVRTVLPWVSLDVLGAASTFAPSGGTDSADALNSSGTSGTKTGNAGQFTLRTGIGYTTLTASHASYRNGFQPVQDVTTNRLSPLRTDDTLSLGSSTSIGKLPLNASITSRREGFESGWQESHRLMVGTTLGRVAFSQSIGLTAVESPTGLITRSQDAQFTLSSSVGPYNLQGEVSGQKNQGAFRMQSYATTMTRVFNSGVSLQAALRGNFQGSGGPSLTASLMQQKGRFGWGLDGSYSKSSSSIGIRIQASLGRNPRNGRLFTDAQPQASMGAVSALAFLDTNGNGKRDPDERVLENAQFKVGDTARPEIRTDAKSVLYTGVSAGRDVQISLEGASLEDNSFQPLVPSYTIRPRAGVVVPVDYPVVVLGEAMGTCRIRRGKLVKEMPGLLVELTDANGRVVQSQRSAFDGFYEFRNIPLGKYNLRVPQSEVDRLKLKAQPTRALDLTIGKAYAEGQDLIVEFIQQIPEPEPPPVKSPGSDPAQGPVKTPVPDPALDPQIHIFPLLDPKPKSLFELPPLLPSLQPIFPRLGGLSAPMRLAPAPRLAEPSHTTARFGRTPEVRFHSVRRTRKPASAKALPKLKTTKIAETRKISRAVEALTFGDFCPWSGKTTGFAKHQVHTVSANALLEAKQVRPGPTPLPDTWTLLLLSARHMSTVDLVRRRLGYYGKDLLVHTTAPGDPMHLLLGRYAGREAAEVAQRRLSDTFLRSYISPSVVPLPNDGVIS